MKTAAIIGFGRFGQLLAEIFADDLEFSVVEHNERTARRAEKMSLPVVSLDQLIKFEVIFVSVPIAKLEDTLVKIKPIVTDSQLVMDVCSVKVYPAKIMQQHLPSAQTIATHPLFGPDSAKSGLEGLKTALCPINASEDNISFIDKLWQSKGVKTYITTPEKHDHDAIHSLAFTHWLSKFFHAIGTPDLEFDTKSYQAVKRVADLSAKDSDQLFHDMFFYNPYLKDLMPKLKSSFDQTYQLLENISNEVDSNS